MDNFDSLSRRSFIVAGSAAAGIAAARGMALPVPSLTESGRPVIHIMGHSHIDAAWLWPWRDGSNLVLTTVRSALDRMQETPGFCYSHSSSMHYRWIQDADPGMFAEIQQRIREGRWEVVGGWPVEPDCNIPATESFVRHALYGKAYCQKNLGVDVKIGFNPDSFGHGAGLPTILRQSGYRYYSFMRPRPNDGATDHPFMFDDTDLPLLFWWEGPDGSRILTLRIWKAYETWENTAEMLGAAPSHVFAPGFHDGAFFLGVGDHGGAATKEQIRLVLEMQKDPNLPELRWSTLREFFAAVESSPAMADLPVIRGGLQHHARGCYSACGEVKYNNRRAERAVVEAESIALLGNLQLKRDYPDARFASEWWNILFNQFHDVLAGSSLYSNYQNVRDGFGSACQLAMATKIGGLEAMARRVDTSRAVAGVTFAFNSLPWPRRVYLEYIPSKGSGPITHLKAEDGTLIPAQSRPPESMMIKQYLRLAAWVDLPAFGYRVFSEESGTPPPAPAYNSHASIATDAFGISSLKTDDGTELLSSPLGLVVIDDPGDTWAHGVNQFRKEIGRPTFISSEIVEDGPVLRVTRQKLRWQQSEIAVDISEFPQLNLVKLHFVINWREHQQILKLEVPTALETAKVSAMVPGAVESRPTSGDEEPYQDWVALEGQIGGSTYAVGLLNNCTYSYDCLDNLLCTILIRSAPYAQDDSVKVQPGSLGAWQDQGRQERIFWLTARSGNCFEQNFDRLANELQSPAEYVMDSRHKGTAPWEDSFLEISPSTVSLAALKRAEDAENTVILRVQERSGKDTTMHIRSKLLGLREDVPLRPWEIKTLRIEHAKGHESLVHSVSLLES